MSKFEFIGVLLGHLAWPATSLIVIFLLKQPLIAALSRVAKLRHGDTEVTFSEISKKILTEELPKEENKRLMQHQIVYKNDYSRLYSNGFWFIDTKSQLKLGKLAE